MQDDRGVMGWNRRMRGSIALGEGPSEEMTGLKASIYGREQLVFSRQQICDDLLNSLPKLHAALRSNPSRNELWRRLPSDGTRVDTFELAGVPPIDGGNDGTQVLYAVAATTQLQCHMNEVLNILGSQTTSDYEATMRTLSGKSFEGGEILYREQCRLIPNDGDTSDGSQALLGVQMAAFRPSWHLRMAPNHLRHPEHPRSQRLYFASLTHRYAEAHHAVHVMKTLPKLVHDQISPVEYRSALRDPVDHLGIAFDIASEPTEDGPPVTRIFVHAYVAAPVLDASTRSFPGLSRLWEQRGLSLESKHVLEVLTNQLKEFERVIARRRYGFQSFIYFQPSQAIESSFTQQFNLCHICFKRFSLFRRELYCQICGLFVCEKCSHLSEVEARVGEVRENRLCLRCVKRVNSCTFSHEDVRAALGPPVVSTPPSIWSRLFSKTDETDRIETSGTRLLDDADLLSLHLHSNETGKRLGGLAQLRHVLHHLSSNGSETHPMKPVTTESVQTQLEQYVNHTLEASQSHFDAWRFKVADSVRDYRFEFDPSQTTYDDQPLPPTPSAASEAHRLHYLHASGVFEPEYDLSALDLVAQVAAKRLKCPIGFVSFVRETVAHVEGTYRLQTPRPESMCAHTIYLDKPLIIKNAASDVRFARLFVVRDGGIRFYAGFPIRAPDGFLVATLGTWDRIPHHHISTADYAVMHTLARVAAHLIAPRNRGVQMPYQPSLRPIANCRMNSRMRRRQGKQESTSWGVNHE